MKALARFFVSVKKGSSESVELAIRLNLDSKKYISTGLIDVSNSLQDIEIIDYEII